MYKCILFYDKKYLRLYNFMVFYTIEFNITNLSCFIKIASVKI